MVANVSGFCGPVFAMLEVDDSVLDVVRVILLEFSMSLYDSNFDSLKASAQSKKRWQQRNVG
jgi:hypothetical protein